MFDLQKNGTGAYFRCVFRKRPAPERFCIMSLNTVENNETSNISTLKNPPWIELTSSSTNSYQS